MLPEEAQMEINLLGISGSPVKGGNTDAFLQQALEAAGEQGATTEFISLAKMDIRDCIHCNWCLRKQEEGKYCNQHDDMYHIYPKVLEADGLLLATPVYFTRLSGYMAVMLDRFRCLGHGNHYHRALRNKVGGALVVSWYRNTGTETGLLSLLGAFLASGMVVVPPGLGLGSPMGAVGLSSDKGEGGFDPKDRLGVLKDEYGVASARQLGKEAVDMARLIKAGQQVLKGEAVA
jgi:multimeric flavodoxin WrbA